MFRLKLSSVPNPDQDEWFAPAPTRYLTVSSIDDASKKCQAYIARYNLGAGNWAGGQVTQDGKQVALISYNGRVG